MPPTGVTSASSSSMGAFCLASRRAKVSAPWSKLCWRALPVEETGPPTSSANMLLTECVLARFAACTSWAETSSLVTKGVPRTWSATKFMLVSKAAAVAAVAVQWSLCGM